MTVNIKIGVRGRHAKPVTKADLVTNVMFLALSLVMALHFVPYLLKHNMISHTNATVLEIGFAVIAGVDLVFLVDKVQRLRKQNRTVA
jgi:hypothetical protein